MEREWLTMFPFCLDIFCRISDKLQTHPLPPPPPLQTDVDSMLFSKICSDEIAEDKMAFPFQCN